MTKQEFARIVQAWADGEEIEVRRNGGGNEWYNLQNPIFIFDCTNEYRIKPKTRTFLVFPGYSTQFGSTKEVLTHLRFMESKEPLNYQDHIKIEFNEKTDKFISAEVVEAKE